MPWYHFIVTDEQGKPQRVRVQATDLAQARAELTGQGHAEGVLLAPRHPGQTGKVTPRELSVLARQFSVIIRSDITLVEGVETLAAQSENAWVKKALDKVRAEVEEGISFADAMARQADVFPAYFLSMVRIGEVSGSLDQSFERLAVYYEKEHLLRRRIRAAVTYPIVLSVMMLAVIALLMVRVLPMFDGILTGMGGQMPALTEGLMGVSAFLGRWGLWLVLLVAVLALLPWLLGRLPGCARWYDRFQLSVPVIGGVRRRIITTRFAQSLALLLRSGVSVGVALSLVSDMLGNVWVADRLERCRLDTQQGKPLDEALEATGLFPALLIRMARVGQKTGRLDDILMNSAALFDEEVDAALERMTGSIEPVLIILLSVVVGLILFAIMMPMIDILSVI